MERKIGETFEFEGETLQVKEIEEHTCEGCFFKGKCVRAIVNKEAGECFGRVDKKNVIFTEIKKTPEKPEPQEEQELNLLEILKYCPEGTEFWSPLLGNLLFSRIDKGLVFTTSADGTEWDFNPDSTITFKFDICQKMTSPEPMLFPSKEQRDWSKVEYKQPIDKLPKSWQEFCETHEVQKGEAYIDGCCNILGENDNCDTRDVNNDRNILPNKQACRQHLALMQLHQLRDCYRQGWKPEHNKTCWNIILFKDGEFQIHEFEQISSFLSFGNHKTARAFLNRFEDLIKEAGDLI